MAHSENLENLSLEERKFRECVDLGDNFMKIEIYYLADRWYEQAAKMQPDNREVIKKWEDCRRLHKKENQTIYAIVAAMAVIVLVVLGIKLI